MMNRTKMVGAIAVCGLLVAIVPTPSQADGSCSSPDACGRHVTCPGGYTATNDSRGSFCSKPTSAATRTPTCGFWNLRNDWVWVPTAKACRNGAGTLSTQNIKCEGDGYGYQSSSGRCEKPAGTAYTHALLTTNGQFSGTVRACDTRQPCEDEIKCKSGYGAARVIAPGPANGEWYCAKSTPAIDAAPKCVYHNFRGDWTWIPSLKVCRNGAGTTTTVNRRCDDGTYDPASGRCRAPSRQEYDEPSL
ncbi:MAG: hypothetical protein IPF92_17825 [Myxococcales bacterium]|jgi:hypothetical protein|nr:hypothetical protein [Myxococcales bacterium]MBL0196112.1 hypothetical protein [Myxococcales bacterium]HQY62960.1 hypothetical protein [Polyangiaceae bacterium]